MTITYVGSEGHFVQLDCINARGLWANDLDPKYLYLGTTLADAGTGPAPPNNLTCPANFSASQALSTALKPFPFQTVTDSFGYVGNSNYHALQALLNMRTWHGLTLNANYTWSRSIDDGGTFRTGYAIPAGTLANHPRLRSRPIALSAPFPLRTSHNILSRLQFGHGLSGNQFSERMRWNGQSWEDSASRESSRITTGSPLALTESSSQTNPAESNFEPILNPNFTGSRARTAGGAKASPPQAPPPFLTSCPAPGRRRRPHRVHS